MFYEVIATYDLAELNTKVNKRLLEGWLIVGSIETAELSAAGTTKVEYLQTMYDAAGLDAHFARQHAAQEASDEQS